MKACKLEEEAAVSTRCSEEGRLEQVSVWGGHVEARFLARKEENSKVGVYLLNECVIKEALNTPTTRLKGRVRRSTGSGSKWMQRLVRHQERMVQERGGSSRLLLRILQKYIPSTSSQRVRRKLSARNLASDFEKIGAESRPLYSTSGMSKVTGSKKNREDLNEGFVRDMRKVVETPTSEPVGGLTSGNASKYALWHTELVSGERVFAGLGGDVTWWSPVEGGWLPASPVFFCWGCQRKESMSSAGPWHC